MRSIFSNAATAVSVRRSHLGRCRKNDSATYAMLQEADSIGVFQVESRAQQSMLPRMKPACFYDIVMQVAIIRPGPIQGDMIHPFLRRRNGLEAVTYPHPKLKPVLERTLGVPLFQEQGMRMAVEAAGFSPGQADQLRRAMGHKRSRERMAQIYPKLVEGMLQNGIDRTAAEQLFHMLEGFCADLHGFPESHAASFSCAAGLRVGLRKMPRTGDFLCGDPQRVQPMGFYSTEVLVNDARRHGVIAKPVEVNASEYWSFVDDEGALRLGFHLVRGLGEGQREQLASALERGPFGDMLDFARRTQLTKDALENLAIAGAFAPWFATRREAMWALRGLDEREARGELGRVMEIEEPSAIFKPLLPVEETTFDIWGLGLSTKYQPIVHFRAQLDAEGVIAAKRLAEMPNHLVCKVGGMVITRQRPGTAKGFVFLTLEDETGLVNVIVRPDVYERNRRVIRLSAAMIIQGNVSAFTQKKNRAVLTCWRGTFGLWTRAARPMESTPATSTKPSGSAPRTNRADYSARFAIGNRCGLDALGLRVGRSLDDRRNDHHDDRTDEQRKPGVHIAAGRLEVRRDEHGQPE